MHKMAILHPQQRKIVDFRLTRGDSQIPYIYDLKYECKLQVCMCPNTHITLQFDSIRRQSMPNGRSFVSAAVNDFLGAAAGSPYIVFIWTSGV